MQKVLIVSTSSDRLRDEIVGWTYENGDAVMEAVYKSNSNGYDQLDIPVGLIGSASSGNLFFPKYPTVLHAIGNGWKLLAPPKEYKEVNGQTYYEWWLVKD